MKKTFTILFLLSLLLVPVAGLADTVYDSNGKTITANSWGISSLSQDTAKLVIVWTDDGGDGIAATDIPVPDAFKGRYLFYVEVDPGATAPTANYDPKITKKDNGVDVFNGNLDNRSATVTQAVAPSPVYPMIDGDLQLTITGNLVSNATGTITIFLVR